MYPLPYLSSSSHQHQRSDGRSPHHNVPVRCECHQPRHNPAAHHSSVGDVTCEVLPDVMCYTASGYLLCEPYKYNKPFRHFKNIT